MSTLKIGSRILGKPEDYSAAELLGSAQRLESITKGTPMTGGPCKAVLVGTAGTANFTDYSGSVHTNVPLQAGYNPIVIQSFQSGGTADDIWAMY